MRGSRLLGFVLVAAAVARSAAGEAPPADPCGEARLISQSYTAVPARVLAVESGDRLQVRVIAGKHVPRDLVGTYAVRLVAIEAPPERSPAAAASRARLAGRLLGRKVHLLISPFQEKDKPCNVMIQTAKFDYADENLGQIAAGMARAVDQGPYAIDWYLRCQYGRAEAAAQNGGLGMWAPGN